MHALTPIEFEQLLVFLKALQDCNFNLKNIPSFVTINGTRIPVENTTHCLELLRSIPDLQGERFKDDNFLVKYLAEPDNMKRVLGQFTLPQQSELTKVLEIKPAGAEEVSGEASGQGVSEQQEVPVGTTTDTSTSGMPGMPSGPSISPAQRRIYRVSRQEPEPKPEIHIANASGYVTEPGDASKLVRATESGKIVEPGQPSKLVTATESGAISEPGQPSKLVVTDSSGKIVEKPPSKIFIANSSGAVTGERPIMPASAPKLPSRKKEKKRWFGRLRPKESSNFLNLLDNPLVDKLGRWLYQNAIKPLAQWLGRNVLQPLARLAAQTAGRLLVNVLPRLALGALNALIGMLGGILGAVGGLAGLTFALGSMLLWLGVALVAFVVVTVLATFLSPFITPIKEPVQVNYTLPLRNPNVSPHPQPIQDIITQTWPTAHIGNWQTIIDAAIANNWNPALLLTLWVEVIEASGAQEKVDPSLVCDRDPTKTESNLDLNLRCFFGKFDAFKDNQFPDFIKDYAGSNTTMIRDYQEYAVFLQRIKDWYSKMVLEGELGAITSITPGEASGISGCPVQGKITTPFGINIPNYTAGKSNLGCSNDETCHNGIDIEAEEGREVRSIVTGTVISYEEAKYLGKYVAIKNDELGGITVTFEHLKDFAPQLYNSSAVKRGDIIGYVGKTDGNTGVVTGPHLHYRINNSVNKGNAPMNPFNFMAPSDTIDLDVLLFDTLKQNDYSGTKHSDPDNWGTCAALPSP